MLQRVLARESLILEEKEEPSFGGVKIGASHMQPLPNCGKGSQIRRTLRITS